MLVMQIAMTAASKSKAIRAKEGFVWQFGKRRGCKCSLLAVLMSRFFTATIVDPAATSKKLNKNIRNKINIKYIAFTKQLELYN